MTKRLSRQEGLKAGILLLVYVVFMIFPPTQRVIEAQLPKAWSSNFALNASMYAVPILVAVVFYGQSTLQNFHYFQDHPWRKSGRVLFWFVALLFGNLLANLLVGVGKTTSNQAGITQMADATPLWATTLLLVILGPLLEENVFRRVLLSDLSQVIPRWLAITISGCAFVLIHVNAPQDIISYAPLGIIFTAAYVLNGENIAFTWSLHMLNNLMGVLATAFVTLH